MDTTGKYFSFFFFLLIFHFITPSYSNTSPDLTQLLTTLNQHISQLNQLDDLIKNLTQLITKLESQSQPSRASHAPIKTTSLDHNPDHTPNDVVDDESLITETKVEPRLSAVSVTKHSLFWSERFTFVSAVKLETKPTALTVLPFKDIERLTKYIAVGDNIGNLYVFTRYGEVMVQFDTGMGSGVTSLLSYLSVSRNESVVVTGHENGVILVHRVWEVANGEDSSLVRRETVRTIEDASGLGVRVLEVHHVGRMRYIVATDDSGAIKVFKELGSVVGTVVPESRPVVFLKQKLLFLTETGAGSLDLRSMKLREAPCEGLNGSYVLNYVFDVLDRGKAYGFSSAGELVHLLIYGDSMNFKCRVRSKKRFDVEHGPLAFEAIKGYFLIVSQDKVFVYNVSSQLYVRAGLPRLVFSAGLDEIVASFLNYRAMGRLDSRKNEAKPLIASDHEKLVILSLGNGYIGMYHSNLPVMKGESSTMLWSTPVLFFVLFLFVAWHFFANKKEALTSWGPDDPFANAPPTGSVERSFGDPTSRNHDIMDMRSGGGAGGGGANGSDGGIRGLPRRYGSPTRYTGPGSNAFRSTAIDPNPRAGSVEPDFIGSELKYRGPSMESSGFGKRREGLFVNSQVVDDQGS